MSFHNLVKPSEIQVAFAAPLSLYLSVSGHKPRQYGPGPPFKTPFMDVIDAIIELWSPPGARGSYFLGIERLESTRGCLEHMLCWSFSICLKWSILRRCCRYRHVWAPRLCPIKWTLRSLFQPPGMPSGNAKTLPSRSYLRSLGLYVFWWECSSMKCSDP